MMSRVFDHEWLQQRLKSRLFKKKPKGPEAQGAQGPIVPDSNIRPLNQKEFVFFFHIKQTLNKDLDGSLPKEP